MASKKKEDDMNDDVTKAQSEAAKGARAVGSAAKALTDLRFATDTLFAPSDEWGEIGEDVDMLDEEFMKEEVRNLKQKFESGDMEVRVMQVGPNGSLIDVSDKINPTDLRPDQIGGILSEKDLVDQTPTRSPRNREAALALLKQILPGFGSSSSSNAESRESQTANSIRRMEATLAESDKILEHWKK